MPKPDFEAESFTGAIGEELDLAEVESVKRLIQLFTNTLKSLLIYPENNPLPKEFKKKFYQSLVEFLDSQDELNLEIAPSQILYQNKTVHEDGEREEGIAYLLHGDGIRELTFLKGLDQGEIDDLIEVLETCSTSRDLDEDLVTMLWEKDFNHIKYLVVDDLLDVDVPKAEDVPDRLDFNRLYCSEISLADQSTYSEQKDRSDFYEEEQTRKLLEKVKEFTPEEMGSIQTLLEMEERYHSLDNFFDILNELLTGEQDFAEFSQMMETQQKVLDALITAADFQSAALVVQRLKRFEETIKISSGQKDQLGRQKAEKTAQVIAGAGEEEKIKRITQVLNEKEKIDLPSVKEYLLSLNWNSIPPILHMLRELKEFSARKMTCEVLKVKGKDHPELFKEGISDLHWYVVRNVVSVLGAIGSMEGLKLLKQCIHHPDLRVRKEVINSLIKTPGPAAGALLASFLEDEDQGIRILAARGLARRKEKVALPSLMTILKDNQFKDKHPEEKKYMLESLASIGGSEAIPFLVKMVNKRGWLKRDKHNETRAFAIGALSLMDNVEAKEALLQLSKKRNKVVRQACQNALHRIDRRSMRGAETSKTT